MKKAGIILLALLAIIIILCGCGKKPEESTRFLVIVSEPGYTVMVDTETGVEYAVSRGTYNGGNFTMLCDSYGNPYVFPGFDAREDKP